MSGIPVQPMQDLQAFLTPKQVRSIIDAAQKSKSHTRDRDVILLGFLAYTGRRVGEILRVKVKDIMWDEQQIVFDILKKKKPLRKVKSINGNLFRMLHRYLYTYKFTKEDHIFASTYCKGKPITDARVRQIVYKYAKEAGIPDFAPGKKPHPHTFRHSFAVANARRMKTPSDLRKLQMVLEHSSINVTTHYLQFADKDQRDMVEGLYEDE